MESTDKYRHFDAIYNKFISLLLENLDFEACQDLLDSFFEENDLPEMSHEAWEYFIDMLRQGEPVHPSLEELHRAIGFFNLQVFKD